MPQLLTTTQVRNIMRANGGTPEYTNKTAGHTGNVRRVKAYYRGNSQMLIALQNACGALNVTLTKGVEYSRSYMPRRAVTVRCVIG